VLQKFAGQQTASLFVAPEIPEKSLKGVATYLTVGPGEEVLVVHDETVRSNGKRGFALTNRQLAWCTKADAKHPVAVELRRIDEITHKIGKLNTTFTIRVGDDSHTLELVTFVLGSDQASVLFGVLQGVVQRLSGGTPGAAPADTGDGASASPGGAFGAEWPGLNAATPREAVLGLFSAETKRPERLSVAPELSDKVLRGATAKYLQLTDGEEPLVLFDDTVTGSGKKGFCLTDRRFIWNGGLLGGGGGAVAYADVRGIGMGDKAFRIDTDGPSHEVRLTQWAKPLVNLAALALARFCSGPLADEGILLISRGIITDIGGTEMEDHGTIVLCRSGLYWFPIGSKPVLAMTFDRIVEAGKHLGLLVVRMRDDEQVSIKVGMRVASRWLPVVRKAREEALRLDIQRPALPETASSAFTGI